MPWRLLSGVKCGPADSNAGASHLPTLWMWKARSPAGMPLSESLIKTPPGVCVSSTTPTSLPLLSLRSVWADCAAAGNESPAVRSEAIPTLSIDFKMVMNELRSDVVCIRRPRRDCRPSLETVNAGFRFRFRANLRAAACAALQVNRDAGDSLWNAQCALANDTDPDSA